MQRISDERFIDEKFDDRDCDIIAIRISLGEFFFIAKKSNHPLDNSKILTCKYKLMKLQRDTIVVTGNMTHALCDAIIDHAGSNAFEKLWITNQDGSPANEQTEKDFADYKNPYEKFLSLVCSHKNEEGNSDENDHDIFYLSRDELSTISDVLRDGDYIFVMPINE